MSEQKYMYRVCHYFESIKRLQVVKETAKMVTYIEEWCGREKERKAHKRTSSDAWFHTWQEAKSYLEEHARDRLKYAKQKVDRRREGLRKIQRMKEPKS